VSHRYITCVCLCTTLCMRLCGSLTPRERARAGAITRGGGREHESSQIQQPQVTWDHRLAGLPRLLMPNHPWLIIETSCALLQRSSKQPTDSDAHLADRLQNAPFCSPSTRDGNPQSRFSCAAAQSNPHLWSSCHRTPGNTGQLQLYLLF